MTHATLPPLREAQTLDALKSGESSWAAPWAISVDLDGRMWLNLGYPQRDTQGGTSQLFVTHEEDGSWSAVLHDDSTWTRQQACSGVALGRFEVQG